MTDANKITQAKAIIAAVRGNPHSNESRCQHAIILASLMLTAAQAKQTRQERRIQDQLARMMQDPLGKVFTTQMTDQCFRSQNPRRIADQLLFLINTYGIPSYLSLKAKIQLWAFKLLGPLMPGLLVPLVKDMVRKETASVILPGEPKELSQHMQQRRKEGVRVNLNHLGEAILGEEEAQHRLQIYLDDLANPDVDYISVKISTIDSQLNLLNWKGTLTLITERLKKLYRAAQKHSIRQPNGKAIPKFVNLDMEEYRDLYLTVAAFQRALNDPEFLHYPAGIVLQSYLPNSFVIQQELTSWAKERVAKGGTPIKIRIVKGANLGMERVEASLRCWPQAPYATKTEVDANYKRMVLYGSDPKNAECVHLGIGSHNLFDIAYALLLRAENQIEPYVCFEMLEGMADHIRRVVQTLSGDMLLYCPTATREEFQYAVAYLVRRLDETTAPENFLRQMFNLYPESSEWALQADLFARACEQAYDVATQSRRLQDRNFPPLKPPLDSPFQNEPDTDWTLPQNRQWAETLLSTWKEKVYGINSPISNNPIPLVISDTSISKNAKGIGEDPSHPEEPLYRYELANKTDLDLALNCAINVQKQWTAMPVKERSRLLAEVAHGLRCQRANLIGAMVADTGKTVMEADIEVSEAIDFAEYYRRNREEVDSFPDVQWRSKGTVLVASPWNFPCAIPVGGITAALAAGNCVIFKPASESVLVGWQLVQIFWQAGISKEVLQFITCEDEPIGSQLVQDPRIACVILTGATATAKRFLNLQPGLDLMAETGGKNAMIITSLSDRELAIKDLVQSAFGHAGQKCSACSLAICEAEVYDDPHFRTQLRDAISSWQVGSPWDLATRLNPLIRTPNSTLLQGLTSLEEGEEWLLQPKQDTHNPNLWSPGIKLGVKPTSFTYKNELFGPILAVMRADNLDHAIKLANGTPYGLTSGLHSLDEREKKYWLTKIEAGNCYINRSMIGAIVQRQPFGGCKESSFGPGAKAGGPNYVMQLMDPQQISLPASTDHAHIHSKSMEVLKQHIKTNAYTPEQINLWDNSVCSYLFFWKHYFSLSHEQSHVLGQDNILRYTPRQQLFVRLHPGDNSVDLLRLIAAASICETPLEVSSEHLLLKDIPAEEWVRHFADIKVVKESEEHLLSRIKNGKIGNMRFLSQPNLSLQQALANAACTTIIRPIMANGRIELLHYLREVSLSINYHRYGYIEGKFVNTLEIHERESHV